MTTLADFLRDSAGTLWKIYASGDGEIVVAHGDMSGIYPDWTEATYITPAGAAPTYRTLADSAGTTWYMYMDPSGSLVLSTTEPTAVGGTWNKYEYISIPETEATIGDEIYLNIEDLTGTDWYVYPSEDGEFILSTTEPS